MQECMSGSMYGGSVERMPVGRAQGGSVVDTEAVLYLRMSTVLEQNHARLSKSLSFSCVLDMNLLILANHPIRR